MTLHVPNHCSREANSRLRSNRINTKQLTGHIEECLDVLEMADSGGNCTMGGFINSYYSPNTTGVQMSKMTHNFRSNSEWGQVTRSNP
jgi:hypothetical protein